MQLSFSLMELAALGSCLPAQPSGSTALPNGYLNPHFLLSRLLPLLHHHHQDNTFGVASRSLCRFLPVQGRCGTKVRTASPSLTALALTDIFRQAHGAPAREASVDSSFRRRLRHQRCSSATSTRNRTEAAAASTMLTPAPPWPGRGKQPASQFIHHQQHLSSLY